MKRREPLGPIVVQLFSKSKEPPRSSACRRGRRMCPGTHWIAQCTMLFATCLLLVVLYEKTAPPALDLQRDRGSPPWNLTQRDRGSPPWNLTQRDLGSPPWNLTQRDRGSPPWNLTQHARRFIDLTNAQAGNKLEGHIFNLGRHNTFRRRPQLQAYIKLVNERRFQRICETGFNGGHSAVLWASLLPTVQIISFDLCKDARCEVGQAFFDSLFPKASLTIVNGDSTKTVPQYAKKHPDVKCDFISVDGGHTGDVPKLDIRNMAKLAKPGALIVMDDVDKHSHASFLKTPGLAWFDAVQSGMILSRGCSACYRKDAKRRTTCTFCIGVYNPSST